MFLTTNAILTDNQYGFRTGMSTETALLAFTKYVLDAFDNEEFIISVFLDLSKAFDTVDHEILLYKLQHYGVRGTALSWFASYLSDRSQFVKVGDQVSSPFPITHGVPQGSVIGPLLFIIYVNDLCNSNPYLNFNLFADDTAVYKKRQTYN